MLENTSNLEISHIGSLLAPYTPQNKAINTFQLRAESEVRPEALCRLLALAIAWRRGVTIDHPGPFKERIGSPLRSQWGKYNGHHKTKHTELRLTCVFVALCGTWEIQEVCEILPRGVGTICRHFLRLKLIGEQTQL